MSKLISTYAALLLCLLLSQTVSAIGTKLTETPCSIASIYDLSREDITQLDRHALIAKAGRKLKLKERLSLKMVKRRLRKNAELTPQQAFQAAKSMLIAGVGLSLAVLGFLTTFYYRAVWSALALPFAIITLCRNKYVIQDKKSKWIAIGTVALSLFGIIAGGVLISRLLWLIRILAN